MNRSGRYILIFSLAVFIMLPLVTGAMMESSLSEMLGKIGLEFRNVFNNEDARFIILVIAFIALAYQLIMAMFVNVPFFGKAGEISKQGRVFAGSLSVLMLIFYFMRFHGKSSSVGFIGERLGAQTTILILAGMLLIIMLIKGQTFRKASILIGSVLLLIGIFVMRTPWLIGTGLLLIILSIVFMAGHNPNRGSVYSSRHYSPHQRERWFSRFARTIGGITRAFGRSLNRTLGNQHGYVVLWDHTKKESEYDDYMQKLDALEEGQVAELSNYLKRPDKNLDFLRERINRLYELNTRRQQADEAVEKIEEEKHKTAESLESGLVRDEHEEEKEVAELESESVKGEIAHDLESEETSVDATEKRTKKRLDEEISHSKRFINRLKKEHKKLEKEKRLLSEMNRIIDDINSGRVQNNPSLKMERKERFRTLWNKFASDERTKIKEGEAIEDEGIKGKLAFYKKLYEDNHKLAEHYKRIIHDAEKLSFEAKQKLKSSERDV